MNTSSSPVELQKLEMIMSMKEHKTLARFRGTRCRRRSRELPLFLRRPGSQTQFSPNPTQAMRIDSPKSRIPVKFGNESRGCAARQHMPA